MKPEFKVSAHAYGLIAQSPLMGRSIETSKDLFLSSLHWRGDELWAGPFFVDCLRPYLTEMWGFQMFRADKLPGRWPTLTEARAALEAAAKKQINEWFEEQAK